MTYAAAGRTFFTSPRRGEVERAQRSEGEGVRMLRNVSEISEPPHPNPLPYGERERTERT
jgi:hypothetical protein